MVVICPIIHGYKHMSRGSTDKIRSLRAAEFRIYSSPVSSCCYVSAEQTEITLVFNRRRDVPTVISLRALDDPQNGSYYVIS